MTAGPTHHPVAALLGAAATGQLSPAVSRLITAHTRFCPHCAAIVAEVELVGGAVLEAEGGTELAAGALERALSTIAESEGKAEATPEALAAVPSVVHDLLAPAVGKSSWYFGGPGLRVLDLRLPSNVDGETFQLLRIDPGHGPPRHTHGGQEFIIVLTGAFRDEKGLYRHGDIAISDESVTHRPVAEPGEVCFALTVTTAPLKFKGPLGILQRILNLGRP